MVPAEIRPSGSAIRFRPGCAGDRRGRPASRLETRAGGEQACCGWRWVICGTCGLAAGYADAAPKARAAWRRASSAASPRLITKVPGWAAVHCCAVAGPVKCST
jgi:hypothetical protein